VSHHIYQTEGIVLKTQNFGESNRLLYILTKKLGLIAVFAQGVRELKSKLRYSVQEFSRIYVDLVRGKEMWRIVNAENIDSVSSDEIQNEKTFLKARVYSFLQRLLQGEERNEKLFEVISLFAQLLDSKDWSTEELSLIEIAVNLKILHLLGYGSTDEEIRKLAGDGLSGDFLREIAKNRRAILSEINRGIKESQL